MNVVGKRDDVLPGSQEFWISRVSEGQRQPGKEVVARGKSPSFADQAAGRKRTTIGVEVVDDEVDQFWGEAFHRHSSGLCEGHRGLRETTEQWLE